MPVVQSIEKLSDVDLEDTPAPHLHQPVPEGVQCLVRRAARPEPVRAVEEVLLVDGLQDLCGQVGYVAPARANARSFARGTG